MRIYISGGITNNKKFKEQFAEAEKELMDLGYSVINPCKNQGFSYKDYIDMGLVQLSKCDYIYMLKGWEQSKGACLEKHYAEAVGIVIVYENKL